MEAERRAELVRRGADRRMADAVARLRLEFDTMLVALGYRPGRREP